MGRDILWGDRVADGPIQTLIYRLFAAFAQKYCGQRKVHLSFVNNL
jgi:hypothetical protein